MKLALSMAILPLLLLTACTSANENPDDGIEAIRTENVESFVRDPVEYRPTVDTNTIGRLEFENHGIDFDSIPEGTVIEREFRFENVGNAAVTIYDVYSSCGCTIPEWPKGPIEPGGSGVIRVRFNAENRAGKQHKPIIVTANAYPAKTELLLTGYVTKKEQKQ